MSCSPGEFSNDAIFGMEWIFAVRNVVLRRIHLPFW